MSEEAGGGARRIPGGGLLWILGPVEGPDLPLIERTLERWREIPEDPAAEVLKRNLARTVILFDPRRASGGAGSAPPAPPPPRWILKQYRHEGFLDRIRFLFTPSRAVREWRGLRRLRALGFLAPRPIAWGERRAGGAPVEGGLLMEEVPRAVPLPEKLRLALSDRGPAEVPGAAAEVLERAGALLRSLQDRGVDQFDLHAGNFLIQEGGAGGGSIHVIDLHSTRFRRRLGARRRRIGLAKFVQSLKGTVPRAGVLCLLRAYLGLPGLDGEDGARVARLEEAVMREAAGIERRHLRSRSRRCVLESTRFAVERGPGMRIFRRREVPREHIAALFVDTPAGPAIKAGPEGFVAGAFLGARGYLVKRRRYSLGESLRGLLASHRLRRAYRAGFALEVRAVPTPRVLALGEERRLGLVRGAWLLTELIPEAASLMDRLSSLYLAKPPPRGAAARRKFLLAGRVGELIRLVHGAGIYSRDLSPQNILVGAEGEVFLVDLDSVHTWRRLSGKRRLRNLVQAGNLPEGHITWTDRLRALRAYSRGDGWPLSPERIAFLREGILREAERTLARMLKDLRG